MKLQNLKWVVRVPAGRWMAGVHRFATKREATSFSRRWEAVDRDSLPLPKQKEISLKVGVEQ